MEQVAVRWLAEALPEDGGEARGREPHASGHIRDRQWLGKVGRKVGGDPVERLRRLGTYALQVAEILEQHQDQLSREMLSFELADRVALLPGSHHLQHDVSKVRRLRRLKLHWNVDAVDIVEAGLNQVPKR